MMREGNGCMVEHGTSFKQLTGVRVLSIRHFAGDSAAKDCTAAVGLQWPTQTGRFQEPVQEHGAWLVWRSPQEVLAFARDQKRLHTLQSALLPGRFETAAAWDLSEGMAVFELQSVMLDEWLARLVDAWSIPTRAGQSSRCRLADVPVLLMRMDKERVWLAADKPIAPYVSNWLAYTHQGAASAR